MRRLVHAAHCRLILLSVLLVLLVLPGLAMGQAIIGTTGGHDIPVVFPTPQQGLPNPAQTDVTGVPAGGNSHGVVYFGSDSALVSEFDTATVYNVVISSASVIATIATGPCDGTGTISMAPSLQAAMLMGSSSTLCIIRAPFQAGATIDTLTLPGSIAGYQTQAIVFNAAGRAFVHHTTGISVLDPPYTSVAFTIPVSGNTDSGAIAITPGGNQLLATTLGNEVRIYTAPYTVASTPDTLVTTNGVGLDGIQVTPDGSRALVVDAFASQILFIAAPFSSSSAEESISTGSAGSHEDIDVSADGQLAIAAGNGGGTPDTLFIEAPFTAAGATLHFVQITGGRGNGAVRFLPPGLAAGLTISKSAPATVASGANLTYTITYGNTGGADATNVVVRDPIPAGTTFVSATNGGTLVSGEVVWNIGTVPAGTSGQTLQFTVQVTAADGATITNANYTIEGDGVPPIPGPPVVTTVGPGGPVASADLTLSKSSNPNPVLVGEQLTYTLEVTNNGPDAATGVTLTDVLPPQVTFDSVQTTQGTCSEAAGTVTCNLGTLAAAASAQVTIVVTPQTSGSLDNGATVSANESDPAPGNNTDAETTAVNAPAANIIIPALSWAGLLLLMLALGAGAWMAITGVKS